jgi:hypothetical protein
MASTKYPPIQGGVGCYTIEKAEGNSLTFLDNPGNSSVLLELVEKMPVSPIMTSTNIDSQNHLEKLVGRQWPTNML